MLSKEIAIFKNNALVDSCRFLSLGHIARPMNLSLKKEDISIPICRGSGMNEYLKPNLYAKMIGLHGLAQKWRFAIKSAL